MGEDRKWRADAQNGATDPIQTFVPRLSLCHPPVIGNYSLIGVISISDISTAFEDEAVAAARSVPA
jgi:hypothetical protein